MSPLPVSTDAGPTRPRVVDATSAGFVQTLPVAMLSVPPLAVARSRVPLASAITATAPVVPVGYVAGVARLLRPR